MKAPSRCAETVRGTSQRADLHLDRRSLRGHRRFVRAPNDCPISRRPTGAGAAWATRAPRCRPRHSPSNVELAGHLAFTHPVSSTGKSSSGKSDKLARYSGKQFSYAPPKKGQYASDAYFTEFQRLYEVTLPPPSRCARHSSRLYLAKALGHRCRAQPWLYIVRCRAAGGRLTTGSWRRPARTGPKAPAQAWP